jgi:hypothetical protein
MIWLKPVLALFLSTAIGHIARSFLRRKTRDVYTPLDSFGARYFATPAFFLGMYPQMNATYLFGDWTGAAQGVLLAALSGLQRLLFLLRSSTATARS